MEVKPCVSSLSCLGCMSLGWYCLLVGSNSLCAALNVKQYVPVSHLGVHLYKSPAILYYLLLCDKV